MRRALEFRHVTVEDFMRIRSVALLVVIGWAALVQGQSQLPADIHPVSLSRVPPVQRADLDEEGKRIWDALAGPTKALTPTGPSAVTMHSPRAAEPIYALNQYLRKTVAGARFFELAALVAAREFDQQYEWSAHEPAAIRAGVEQSIVDAIKFNRNLAGVPDKDATVIRLGRAIFRDHRVSPDLWAQMVQHFGRQGAMEVTLVMADYAMVGFVLTAVDQQLPADRKPLLPLR
jgi:4-carboxymuconolactone decarboxylase